MPSFDIQSKIDTSELNNAVNQSISAIENRFDFKGIDATIKIEKDKEIILQAPDEFTVNQMKDVLDGKLIKRGFDTRSFEAQPFDNNLAKKKLVLKIKQGIDQTTAKKIVSFIKNNKFKVQAAIQGDELRVSGKNRDDLQDVIAALKKEDFDLPLAFANFRD